LDESRRGRQDRGYHPQVRPGQCRLQLGERTSLR
jgi:hypothetical protein